MRSSLSLWIVIGVVAGVVAGVVLHYAAPEVFQADRSDLSLGAEITRSAFDLAKGLFMNLLRMIVVPLILTSIVAGMLTVGDADSLGRLGAKTLIYYLGTSTLAILTGLVLVNLIQPGMGAELSLEEIPAIQGADKTPLQFLVDFFIELIPLNPFAAIAEAKMLQIIFFALLVGFFITRLPEPHRGTLTGLFQGGFNLMMRVVHFVFLFAPTGVFALVASIIAREGLQAFSSLGWYAATVFLGLVIHATVTLPLILMLVARVKPQRHAKAMAPALLTAFSTASSGGTLPITIECAEKRAGVSNRVTSFVLPLGATVNMDGTALYECVAAIFIAQIYVTQGVIEPLTFGQQFLVVVTALAASIGAAAIPHAGLVMMAVILKAIGLPFEAVGYIWAVDRFLDMCRTSVNVWSDSCGAVVIARTEGEKGILTEEGEGQR